MGDITAHLCTDGTANRMEKADDAGKRRDKYKNKVLGLCNDEWNPVDT